MKIEVRDNQIYIENGKYTEGVHHLGAEKSPNFGKDYIYLQWSDIPWMEKYYVDLNNKIHEFSDDESLLLRGIVSEWEQEIGQEGNPTIEQAREFKLNELKGTFNLRVSNITTALPHEMASWRKQEEEARAYLVDNSLATPFLDVLVVTRNLGETKEELISKVIANADAYEIAYAVLLGKFQNLSKAIDYCTTVKEVEAIRW